MIAEPDTTVILTDNRKQSKLVTLKKGKKLTWRNQSFEIDSLIGTFFGTVFKVQQQKIVISDPRQFYQVIDESNVDVQTHDNRNIFSNDDAQLLDHQQIQELKKHKKGEQIIQTIAQSNVKFNERTAFSKQKYLKRKKQKYLFYFICQPVTPHSLAKYYFQKDPKSISYLRPDALAFILTYSAFRPASRILLVDRAKNLGLACIAKRTAGLSKIYLVQENTKQNLNKCQIMSSMNLKQHQLDCIKIISKSQVTDNTYTHVIIIGQVMHDKLLQEFYPNLESGAVYCGFSQYSQLLGQAFDYMVSRKRFLNIQLNQIFTRQIQVISQRTHPMMNMHKFSGYILWGIKCESLQGQAK